MADLLVHAASAYVAARPLRDHRLRSIVYVGVCLPDLLYKGLLYFGGAPNYLCEPTHSPLGLLPFCYALSLFFEEAWRKRAFGAMLGGAYLHLLFDLGKNYVGSVTLMLPALAVIALVELCTGRLRRRWPLSRPG